MFGIHISKISPKIMPIIERLGEEGKLALGEAIVRHSRRIIDESVPTGRIYRRSRFKRGDRLGGFRASGSGQRFHRASAKGQPPAKDTGKLYDKISVSRVGRKKVLVKFNAPYAGYVEFRLDRPFILPAIKAAIDEVYG